MDLTAAGATGATGARVADRAGLEELAAAVAGAPAAVAPVGGRTHWGVGGPAPAGPGVVEVRAPAGVVAYDPAELTVTVGAGTTVGALDAVLAAAGQECPLDPRRPEATVGGVLATGLSGPRRLRTGPVRDTLLEARFVTAAGRVVKAGGPTVKNVTGYDVCRLLVGSLGTVGVLGRVTLRCRPAPPHRAWATTADPPDEVRARLLRPSSLLWDGRRTHVLLEGRAPDVAAEQAAARLEPAAGAPPWPAGAHRGRVSVRPGAVVALGADLDTGLDAGDGAAWLAEGGVGTVHVAAPTAAGLLAARRAAHRHGGWLLVEEGGDGMDPWGVPFPAEALMRRMRDAFDPARRCNPGRLPW